jgi:amino acid permease
MNGPEPVYFSFWVAVAFTINYVIGSGFLTIPWAFNKAGVLLGVTILLLFAFFSVLAIFFILETIERAQILEKYGFADNTKQGNNLNRYADVEDHKAASEQTSLLGNNAVRPRRKEITELCEIFLGKTGKRVYTIVIGVLVYGVLWAYSTVFANSFSALFPLGTYSYPIYLVVFACIVVPLSLMEFSEQVHVQVALSIFRVVMVVTMIVTICIAFVSGEDEFQLGQRRETHLEILYKFDLGKIQYITPVAAYAFIFHHAIPSLADTVQDKTSLNSLFQITTIICGVFYIFIGSVVAVYFGSSTNSACNLNWVHYVGTGYHGGKVPLIPLLIKSFVILFPAIDVASAYPLNAFSLGNSIMSAYYGKRISEYYNSRWTTTIFRASAAVPPILCALFVSDLGKITDYTGMTGFLLAFVFPPLLARYSQLKLESFGLNPKSIHSSFWTGTEFQALIFVTGLALVFYVGGCLLFI